MKYIDYDDAPDGGNYYLLSTGKMLAANCGILGLSPTENELFDGYDNVMYPDDPDYGLTAEERREVADYMIERWKQFGGISPSVPQGKEPTT